MNAQIPATRIIAAPLPGLAHRARLVFISAERSDYPHAVNAARSHYLLCELARLQRLHHVQMIWPCQGMYAGQREQAYCILAADLLDVPLLAKLAAQGEQESILVAEPGPDGLTGKLVFTDGSGAPDAPLGRFRRCPWPMPRCWRQTALWAPIASWRAPVLRWCSGWTVAALARATMLPAAVRLPPLRDGRLAGARARRWAMMSGASPCPGKLLYSRRWAVTVVTE